MVLNGTDKIYSDGGKYVLLVDYGSEGMSPMGQYDDLQEAIRQSLCGAFGSAVAILQLVDIPLDKQESK